MNIRTAIRAGVIIALVTIFLILTGLVTQIAQITTDTFGIKNNLGGWLILWLLAVWGGVMSVRGHAFSWKEMLTSGISAGVTNGFLLAIFVWIIDTLAAGKTEIRDYLIQVNPKTANVITFGQEIITGALLIFASLTLFTLVGALIYWSLTQKRKTDSPPLLQRLTKPMAERVGARVNLRLVSLGLIVVVLLLAPFKLGSYWNYTLGTVGIYVLLGLGLNIVVGMAGLLDLGYVAFYAIGAYTIALLTAPIHNLGISFWVALPLGIIVAGLSGVLLGIPVLRMRGDYLAIVTLGFGEIIRILLRSDVLLNFTGGPRGVRQVAQPFGQFNLFGQEVGSEFYFMYFIILGVVLVMFLSSRLQDSRIGRAWMAMREDEDVAEAMGIYTLYYKLLAFGIGAAFAGLGGVLFASRNAFAGPEDFTLLVSINVLCLIIVGGMGSIPGVILGALALKGLPEVLRDLDQFRLLAFGALLVAMMIWRPEGLMPSARRKLELHEGEEEPIRVSEAVSP